MSTAQNPISSEQSRYPLKQCDCEETLNSAE